MSFSPLKSLNPKRALHDHRQWLCSSGRRCVGLAARAVYRQHFLDRSGPGTELDLDHHATVRAVVADRGDVDVDIHLLADPRDPGSCLQRAHTDFQASLEPGTWYFAVDSFNASGGERSGQYLFSLVEEPEG